MATLTAATGDDRNDAAAFAGRVARWDPAGPIRLKQDQPKQDQPKQDQPEYRQLSDGDAQVRMWATTPFDSLVTRAVKGRVEPRDFTVHAGNLLAALAVSVHDSTEAGPVIDASWRSSLPGPGGWVTVEELPADLLSELAAKGVDAVKDRPGPAGGASTALLDSEVLTVAGHGMSVPIPLRMLFALSGMGFAPEVPGEKVRVSATDSWVRIDARFGAVVRRRHSLLPLIF